MSMVQLELDDKDKESFNEMQQSMQQANQEIAMVEGKRRVREQEQRLAELTLMELQAVGDDTVAYHQVGKMFVQKPLPELKELLGDKVESCKKEQEGLKSKKAHVEEALKKVNEDFQEFIRAHLVASDAAAGS